MSRSSQQQQAQTGDLATCPICGGPAEPALFAHPVDPQVAALIAAIAPGWSPEQGICPNCVQKALDALAQAGHDLHGVLEHREARKTDPDVAAWGEAALPVPLRLHANPVFQGRGVTICFLDSGFYPHPDLIEPVPRIRLAVDATVDPPVENADFSKTERRSWHGMMTSVVAAGNGYLSGGRYRGIAAEAEVVLVRVGEPTMRIPDAAIVKGLRWIVANHRRLSITVLNISLGGDEEMHSHLSEIDRLVGRLVKEGVVVVVAAGNSGRRQIVPPASAPAAITVGGATDENRLHVRADRFIPWRSSYGPTLDGIQKPELVAPSMWLASPLLPGTRQEREAGRLAVLLKLPAEELHRRWEDVNRELRTRNGALSPERSPEELRDRLIKRMARHRWLTASYQFVDGTSVAAPVVSSVVAQILQANPSLTPEQVKRILTGTAISMNDVPREQQGSGVVNPAAAVAIALRSDGGPMFGKPLSPYVIPGAVTFYYYNPYVEEVALVADFNRWLGREHRFEHPERGLFTLTIPDLWPGVYRYKFLLDHTTAADDPENPLKQPDGYGGFNSLLTVPEHFS